MQPMLNSFQRKHRQKMRNRFLLQLVVTGALVGTAYACYEFGARQEAARIGQKAIELEHVVEERDELRQQVVNLQAKQLEDAKKIEAVEAKYRADIPNDTVRTLLNTVRDKLAAGVSVERLNNILASASNPRNCRDRDTKRFILSTALAQGTQNWAGFGNGAITVSGEGQSAISAEKRPEAWYDPAKPVKMKFTLIGGKVTVAEGNLPLQHSIIDDNIEYRFTISPANSRGFIEVSSSLCDYP